MDKTIFSDLPSHRLAVMTVLPSYVGHSYALLLSLIGYKSLADLAAAPSLAIAGIPGIGPARLQRIERALNDHGLMLKATRPPAMPTLEPAPSHICQLH